MSELLKEIPEESKEPFRVKDDQTAEWCIQKIREAEEEKDFWKEHYKNQLAAVNATCDATIEQMKGYLRQYFDTVPHRKAETQESYPLPSGKLVLKEQEPDYQRDDKEVIKWLKKNGGQKFVKTEEKLDWSGLKKTLSIIGETVADSDGQIIPCIKAVEREMKFGVEK